METKDKFKEKFNNDQPFAKEDIDEMFDRIDKGDFSFLDDDAYDPVSNNPVIQEFYVRFCKECKSLRDYKKLRKEINRYMRKYGTEQDEKDLQEFMESLVMLSEEN